jgi:hypothetical protein
MTDGKWWVLNWNMLDRDRMADLVAVNSYQRRKEKDVSNLGLPGVRLQQVSNLDVKYIYELTIYNWNSL